MPPKKSHQDHLSNKNINVFKVGPLTLQLSPLITHFFGVWLPGYYQRTVFPKYPGTHSMDTLAEGFSNFFIGKITKIRDKIGLDTCYVWLQWQRQSDKVWHFSTICNQTHFMWQRLGVLLSVGHPLVTWLQHYGMISQLQLDLVEMLTISKPNSWLIVRDTGANFGLGFLCSGAHKNSIFSMVNGSPFSDELS